ncbi:hypothetical protein [Arthrobacter sp. 2MCAF14]|uniref:hypothetical protein n=1 Tax=Arthrobacter sp. 2MCAF14 TaxID=3232982 RepID=UPI003F9146FA
MTGFMFADWDDPDAEAIAGGAGLQWLRLAGDAREYDFHLKGQGTSWIFSYQDTTITSEELLTANRVVVRRWRSSPPRPLVVSSEPDPAHRNFVERQWDAAVLAGLHLIYLQRPRVWSRDPTHQDFKLSVLERIKAVVLVPDYDLGTTTRLDHAQLVAKSIHVDQSLGDQGRVATSLVVSEDLDVRQPCPMIFQKRIEAAAEWRLAYSFGRVGVVRQVFNAEGPVDNRFASPSIRESYSSRDVEAEARLISSALGLNLFTADILVDELGQRYWCDINPDGLFTVVDTPDRPLENALIDGLRPGL